MTKSGYQDKVIKNLLAITLYVPLIIAFIASGMKLYDFIYPAMEGKNISEQAFDLRYNLSNSLMLVFRKIFGFLATFSGLLWSWMTDFKTLSITILVVYLLLSYTFTFLYKDNSVLKSWSSYTNIILILGAAFISLGVISLFIKENNDSSHYP